MKAVINTSPLITLAVINKLPLLDELFEKIYVPHAVFKEVIRKGKRKAAAIKAWSESKVCNIKDVETKTALELMLDEGESEVIVLAHEVKADLVIIDEDKGRKIARLNNHKVTGTIGVLLDAKKQGLIFEVKPFIKNFIDEGIYIDERLYDKAMVLASEN